MRLLRPNPGECVDRQTILHIKAREGNKKRLNVKPFTDECTEIQKHLNDNWLLLTPRNIQHDYDTLVNALMKVNERLWELEDKIRELQYSPSAELGDVAATAFEIVTKNDLRAELVKRVNALFGIASQEKLHKL